MPISVAARAVSLQIFMPVMVLAPFNSSAAAFVFTSRTGVSKSMDGWGAICASINLRICASEPSPRCAAHSDGRGACAGDDGRGGRNGRLCAASSHGGGRVGGICAHSQTFTYIHTHSQTFKGGPEVHSGCAHGEAGDPAPSTSTIFQPRPTAQVLPCIDDTKFHDADLLAAPIVASRRRSWALRLALRRRTLDAAGDAACESRPMRAPSETPPAHKNGNWSNESL